MYVWGFCNAQASSNSLDFTSFLDYAFKALYIIFFKTVYHTNDKNIFKLHLKKTVTQVPLHVAHTTYISGPFYEQANLL